MLTTFEQQSQRSYVKFMDSSKALLITPHSIQSTLLDLMTLQCKLAGSIPCSNSRMWCYHPLGANHFLFFSSVFPAAIQNIIWLQLALCKVCFETTCWNLRSQISKRKRCVSLWISLQMSLIWITSQIFWSKKLSQVRMLDFAKDC